MVEAAQAVLGLLIFEDPEHFAAHPQEIILVPLKLGDLVVDEFAKKTAMTDGVFEVNQELVMLTFTRQTLARPILDLEKCGAYRSKMASQKVDVQFGILVLMTEGSQCLNRFGNDRDD